MKQYSIEIKWALIFAAMTLAWIAIERIAGYHSVHLDKHPTFSMFIMIPATIIYVLAFREKRNQFYGGTMSFKEGFLFGLAMTAFITLLTPVTQSLSSLVVSPDYFPNVIKHSVENGLMTQSDAEGYFNLKNYIIQSTIGAVGIGTMTSLVLAFLASRPKRRVSL